MVRNHQSAEQQDESAGREVRVPVTLSHRAHKKQHPFKMGKAGRNGEGMRETPWRNPVKHRITGSRGFGLKCHFLKRDVCKDPSFN